MVEYYHIIFLAFFVAKCSITSSKSNVSCNAWPYKAWGRVPGGRAGIHLAPALVEMLIFHRNCYRSKCSLDLGKASEGIA